jgi:hypothetical protein
MSFLKAIKDKYILVESGLSPILYHWTSIWNAESILKSDKFQLATHAGTSSDESAKNRKKFYYLSTSRLARGGYTKPYGVILELDGVKLQHNYAGLPFDYWGHAYKKISNEDNRRVLEELEDRVVSDKAAIPHASKYIKSVHVMLTADWQEDDSRGNHIRKQLRSLLYKAKLKKLPIFFYQDRNAFLGLRKEKAIKPPFEEWKHDPEKIDKGGGSDRSAKFEKWIELYYNVDPDKLSKKALDTYKNLRYSDAADSLKADIHNERTTGSSEKLLKLWRKIGVNNANEFIEALRKKHAPAQKALDESWRSGYKKGEEAKNHGEEKLFEDLAEMLKEHGKSGVNEPKLAKTFIKEWLKPRKPKMSTEEIFNTPSDELDKMSAEEDKKVEKLYQDFKKFKG